MLLLAIAIAAVLGFGSSFAVGFLRRDGRLLVNGSIATGCCLAIMVIYFTAYWSIKELFWKFGLMDLVLPTYGIVALMMIPLAKEVAKAGWRLATRLSYREVEMRPSEAIEVLRRLIEKQYQEGWLTPSDYEELLQRLMAIRNVVEWCEWAE